MEHPSKRWVPANHLSALLSHWPSRCDSWMDAERTKMTKTGSCYTKTQQCSNAQKSLYPFVGSKVSINTVLTNQKNLNLLLSPSPNLVWVEGALNQLAVVGVLDEHMFFGFAPGVISYFKGLVPRQWTAGTKQWWSLMTSSTTADVFEKGNKLSPYFISAFLLQSFKFPLRSQTVLGKSATAILPTWHPNSWMRFPIHDPLAQEPGLLLLPVCVFPIPNHFLNNHLWKTKITLSCSSSSVHFLIWKGMFLKSKCLCFVLSWSPHKVARFDCGQILIQWSQAQEPELRDLTNHTNLGSGDCSRHWNTQTYGHKVFHTMAYHQHE